MSETGRQENQSQNDTGFLFVVTNQGMQALLEVKKKKKKGKEKDLPQNLHQGKQTFCDTLALT